ncbi:hypothetical protein KAT36_03255 [Candidatus Pacearchaeota archaeon]|nr:hypothetical protein [Candidatus Pacearchaeota archaeon]
MSKLLRAWFTRSKNNRYKAIILSLMLFLSPNICVAEQINILKPFKYETRFKSKLFYNLEDSLVKKLKQNKEILMYNQSEEGGKIKYMDVANMEERELPKMQRDILERAFVNAQIDALSKTPIGKKAERLVDKISSYTRIKYKKSKDQISKLYFLGETDDSSKGEYGISLSASLYPDSNSLRADCSVGIKWYYKGLESELFFRPDTSETKMNIKYENFAIWAGREGAGFLFKKEFW